MPYDVEVHLVVGDQFVIAEWLKPFGLGALVTRLAGPIARNEIVEVLAENPVLSGCKLLASAEIVYPQSGGPLLSCWLLVAAQKS